MSECICRGRHGISRAGCLLLALAICLHPAIARAESEQTAPPAAEYSKPDDSGDSLEAVGCVLKSTAISVAVPALVFLLIAAILESDGKVFVGFNFGGSASGGSDNSWPRDECSQYIRTWHAAGSGSNTMNADTPMAGRGAFHLGYSFRNFEYATFAGAGVLDALPTHAESNIFASFGGELRYFPLGLNYGSGLRMRPYVTGSGMVGWNPEGPDAKALEYGAGLEIGYDGSERIETALYGEGLVSHINAGGPGILPREDDWTWSYTVVAGLRFRWFR